MRKNATTTKKGTGRVHRNGVEQPNRKKRFRQLGGFAQAIRDWITQENLKKISQKKAKAMEVA